MTWCKSTGQVLRKLRLERGMTQQAVADALVVNRATYSYNESGRTQPDLQRLESLAAVFDLPLSQLLELLAHPEQVEAPPPKRRVPKKAANKPLLLGQLHPKEKSLIAMFRRCDQAGQERICSTAKEVLGMKKISPLL